MTFTLLGDIARVILAALAIFGAATVAWGIRAAVRGWKRVPRKPRVRHGRLPLQAVEPDCPWCQVRECMDVSSCTCDGPCGMPLCRALETETAP